MTVTEFMIAEPLPVAGPRWRDTVLLAAGALIACVAATTGTWHGLDAYDWLGRIEQGPLVNERHPLYLPLAAVVARPLMLFGVPVLHAAAAASAVGVALGTAAVHRAFAAFGLPRGEAATATVTVALCFGLLYFGTVVEIHGVYFAAAGAAWWCLAHWRRRPSIARALAVGAISGFGAAIHATGHLLPLPLLLFARASVCVPRAWLHAVALVLAHAVVGFACTRGAFELFVGGGTAPSGGPAEYLGRVLNLGTDWSRLPAILWREWLHPFLPISVVAFLALARCELRPGAIALLACVAGYTAATVVLLAPATTVAQPHYLPPFAIMEYGAYFLPLLVPAAWLSLRALPARVRLFVPALGALWAIANFVWPDRRPGDLDYARDALAVVDSRRAHLVCGGYGELDGLMQMRPTSIGDVFDARPGKVLSVYAMYVWLASQPATFDEVKAWFEVQCQTSRAAGGELIVTEDALAIMRATPDGRLDRLAAEHLPARFVLTPVVQGCFRGFSVAPRN